MTTMIAEVYDAFLQAGAGEEKSRHAAEALAGHEDRFTRLEHRIEGVEATLNRRVDGLEATLNRRIDGLEATLNRRIDGLDRKIDDVETRLRGEQILIRWMLATVLTLVIAITLKLFLH